MTTDGNVNVTVLIGRGSGEFECVGRKARVCVKMSVMKIVMKVKVCEGDSVKLTV